MAIKSLKKTTTQDKDLNKLQTNLKVALQPIINSPIINGNLLLDVTLEAGKRNEVAHGLQRRPLGYIIVRKRKDSRIWDLQDTNPAPTKTFTIACSHDVNVDIWVF